LTLPEERAEMLNNFGGTYLVGEQNRELAVQWFYFAFLTAPVGSRIFSQIAPLFKERG
jgi:hypothetical protein